MAFCVGVMSLSTVSCTKEIEQDIADLKGQVAELAQKIADLEARLTSEVNTLNTAIANLDKKIAVVGVENKDGNVVLTLSNGDKVTVAAPDANANNTNLVTTVTENGKTYWAVVGADGKAKSLGVEVGHPDVKLSFKVNPETKELLISYDGKEYEGTGVLVKNPDDYAHVVTAFEEGEDYVKLTIGEAVYTLPKYVEDNASLVLGRADFFLMYGATKEVSLTAEGIEEYYVMSKPDGWKASIDGTTLYVTAPDIKATEVGAAEAEGLVLVHATTVTGKCKVAKVEVRTGVGLDLAVDREGNITITNAYTSTETDEMGVPTTVFTNMYMGFATPDAFLSDPKAFVQNIRDTYDTPDWSPYFYFYNLNDYYQYQYSYVEVENEVSVATVPVNDVYKAIMYDDMPYGSDVVIWVAPWDEKGQPIAEAVKYVKYSHLRHEVEVTSVAHNDATVELNIQGATKYYVGMTDAWFEENGFSVEAYMKEMGPWNYITNDAIEWMEGLVLEGGEYTGENAIKLSSIFNGEPLNFNTKYYFWVFPYQEGVKYDNYEEQMAPYIYEVTTSPLQAGGSWAATITPDVISYTSISATITPEEGTSVYYKFYTPDAYAAFADDNAVVEALLEDCYTPVTYEYVANVKNLALETSRVLATVSVGADGKYGDVVTETFTTLAAPSQVNEALTAEFTNWAIDYTSITVNVAPVANTTMYYNWYTESAISSLTDAELVSKTIAACYSPATSAKALSKTSLAQGSTQVLVVVVTSEDGKSYNLYKETKTTLSYPYSEDITITLASISQNAESGLVTAVFNVTGADKFVMYNYYSGFSTSNFEKNVLANGATTPEGSYIWKDVVDGTVTVEFEPGYWMNDLHATAYTVADGVVTAIAAKAILKDISEYVPE